MAKQKSSRKPHSKKYTAHTLPTHPYLEHIQLEIETIQRELNDFDKTEEELTLERKAEKQALEACLERYQKSLARMMDSDMSAKIRSYNAILSKTKTELKIMSLLQLFYVVRLGQLGLFEQIDTQQNSTDLLLSITEISDKMVGASVFYATDTSEQVKAQKSKQVMDILRKLEQGADEVIQNDITYKNIKNLLKHIWQNVVSEEEALKSIPSDEANAYVWAVLQFDSMIPQQQIENTQISNYENNTDEQEKVERPVKDEPAKENQPVEESEPVKEDEPTVDEKVVEEEKKTTEEPVKEKPAAKKEEEEKRTDVPLSKTEPEENKDEQKEPEPEQTKEDGWGEIDSNTATIPDDQWEKKADSWNTSSWESPKSKKESDSKGWRKPSGKKTSWNSAKNDEWETKRESQGNNDGWRSEAKADTPPTSPEDKQSSGKLADSEDNWRQGGSETSNRGRGRGRGGGRPRGRGGRSNQPRGRGRGRGRGHDEQQD